jgi:hypothetical protein
MRMADKRFAGNRAGYAGDDNFRDGMALQVF